MDENGQTYTELDDILRIQLKYYEDLYRARPSEPTEAEENYFLDAIDMTVTDESKQTMDQNMTHEELDGSKSKMKGNTSPGEDGIIPEFYEDNWDILKNDFYEMTTYALRSGSLPRSHYLAGIILLYKKGLREELKNWRPISLLNIDYKIISKAIAERVKKILLQVIHSD